MKIQRLTFLILIVIILLSGATSSCPVDCSCSSYYVPFGQSVSCELKSLDAIPSNLPNDTYQLTMGRNQMAEINDNALRAVPSLHILSIGSTQIANIADNAFGENPSLQILLSNTNSGVLQGRPILDQQMAPVVKLMRLYRNKLTKVKDGYFKNLRNLTSLDLSSNDIFVISNNAFEDLVSLQTLTLNGCKLLYIQANLFVHNRNLLQLNLGSNAISTIEDESFAQLVNLNRLELQGNRLRDLNSRLFSNLTNLQTLNVNYNRITRIEDYTFINQNKVEILCLSGNSVTAITSNTFAGLKQIKSLHTRAIGNIKNLVPYSFRDLPEISLIELNDCRIIIIETHAFYNLTGTLTLNLRYNSIVEIQSNAFSGLIGVEKIDLEYNKLKTIRADTFIDMPNLSLVILKGNDILEIEANELGDLPELLFLSLVSNNLICSCKIRPFYLWLKRSATVVDGAICADKNGQRIKTLSNVDECTETTTLFDTTAATTNEVSTNIETTIIQVSSPTTANAGLQDQQETTTVFDTPAATSNEVSTNIETTINQVAVVTTTNDQQDVYTKLSSQMNETISSNERTMTLTSTKSYKNTQQTTYSTSEGTNEDKPDTNISFLQVTLLGVIACILAAIALIIIVIYISYRERCKDHTPMYESTTMENAGDVIEYDVLELPYVSAIQ